MCTRVRGVEYSLRQTLLQAAWDCWDLSLSTYSRHRGQESYVEEMVCSTCIDLYHPCSLLTSHNAISLLFWRPLSGHRRCETPIESTHELPVRLESDRSSSGGRTWIGHTTLLQNRTAPHLASLCCTKCTCIRVLILYSYALIVRITEEAGRGVRHIESCLIEFIGVDSSRSGVAVGMESSTSGERQRREVNQTAANRAHLSSSIEWSTLDRS